METRNKAEPEAPVEQLAQQQKADEPEPEPVRLVFMESILVPVLGGMRIYTTALDDTGGNWEKWSDLGKWHEVPRPVR